MAQVAIVILNYNGRSFLEKFLGRVIDHSAGCDVIVADNASTDDSVAWMQAHHPEVQLIKNVINHGFAGGYNVALEQVAHPYYILLNSDVDVPEGWVEPMLSWLESDPKHVACQPKIKSYAQPDSFEYAGAAGGYIDPLGYPFCRGRIFDTLEVDQGQYDTPQEVFWATGACLMIRREAYWAVGGFDNDFFAHMEEIDLCWRLQQRGYTVGCVPQSKVFHVGGGTLQATSPFKTYLNFRNNLWLLTKNLPGSRWWWTFPLRLVLDGVAGAKFLIEGKPKHTGMIVKAHWHAFAKLGKMWRKRGEIVPLKAYPSVNKWLFVEYFLRKKCTYSEIITSKTRG